MITLTVNESRADKTKSMMCASRCFIKRSHHHHLRSSSFCLCVIHLSSQRETINLGLMSSAGETTASQSQINISPARVYTRSLTTRAQKPGHARSKLNSFKDLHSCFVSCLRKRAQKKRQSTE